MANINDYLTWRGDLSFQSSKFNAVDNLIFAELCYMDYKDFIPLFETTKKVLLSEAVTKLFKSEKKDEMVMGLIVPQAIVDFTHDIVNHPRFANVYVSNYINLIDIEKEIQFSAMCFHIDEKTIYIAFRGTDDSLIGWQENINMMYKFPIPAQEEAAKYLDKICELFPRTNIIVGGHSKGGNLATYASTYCNNKYKKRIINVYSNDGPGFTPNCMNMAKYNLINDKVIKIVPQGSIIGLLLENHFGCEYVVKSTNRGLFQHDGFSWQVAGSDFVMEKEMSKKSLQLKEAIHDLLDRLTIEERVEMTQDFYTFINQSNSRTLLECSKNKLGIIKATKGIKLKNTKVFVEFVFLLFKYGGII